MQVARRHDHDDTAQRSTLMHASCTRVHLLNYYHLFCASAQTRACQHHDGVLVLKRSRPSDGCRFLPRTHLIPSICSALHPQPGGRNWHSTAYVLNGRGANCKLQTTTNPALVFIECWHQQPPHVCDSGRETTQPFHKPFQERRTERLNGWWCLVSAQTMHCLALCTSALGPNVIPHNGPRFIHSHLAWTADSQPSALVLVVSCKFGCVAPHAPKFKFDKANTRAACATQTVRRSGMKRKSAFRHVAATTRRDLCASG